VARTFIAFDPMSGRREVIVEVRPDLTAAAPQDLQSFEHRLYERRVHSGLLMTPATTYFVRDTFATLDFSDVSYEVAELPTSVVFSRTHRGQVAEGEGLYSQAKLWLDAVAGSWSTFVPDEALPFMLPEMVGRLAASNLQEWDDVLAPGD
jgi:hypothetical protein